MGEKKVIEEKEEAMKSKTSLVFAVNGERFELDLSSIDPSTTLVDFLRNKTLFKSVKLGCGEGGCGACVVLLSKYDPLLEKVDDFTVSSCLTLLCSIDGCSITTSEGLGNSRAGFHAVHERIAGFHATQCGFCTPGMSVSMFSALLNADKTHPPRAGVSNLTAAEAEKAVSGNLCRCTGYRPLVDACKSFSADVDIEDLGFNTFCKKGLPCYDHASQVCTFPEFLKKELKSLDDDPRKYRWSSPVSISELQSLLGLENGVSVKLVAGNTSTGYYKEEKDKKYDRFVDIRRIPELTAVRRDEKGVELGAAISISKVIEVLREKESVLIFAKIAAHMEKIASRFVRNTGTIGGNIIMAQRKHFPSDLTTILVAARATVKIMSSGSGVQEQYTLEEFLHRPPLEAKSVLLSLTIPFWRPVKNSSTHRADPEHSQMKHSRMDTHLLFETYRAAPRPLGNALAFLNAAFSAEVSLNEAGDGVVVNDCLLAFGAYGTKHAIRAKKVEDFLAGKVISDEVLLEAISLLKDEIVPDKGTSNPGYRSSLAVTFLFEFFGSLTTNSWLNGGCKEPLKPVAMLSSAQQIVENQEYSPVGKGIEKTGAKLQASGEAVYVDDIPSPENCLYGEFIYSTMPLARIKSIGFKENRVPEGVLGIITYKDIPKSGKNVGAKGFFASDLLFAEEVTHCAGQIIAFLVAESQKIADIATKLVVIDYDTEGLEEPILSVEDAVKKSSLFEIPPFLRGKPVGDINKGMSEAEHKILGSKISFGSQYFFYMETQTALAVPDEDNCMLVYSSTQAPEFVQRTIAGCLGVPEHNVRVITRRVGGGFGGKVMKATQVAAACALGASIMQCPVRTYVNRKTDMITTGGRHPMKITYSVGFKSNGKITALDLEILLDAGLSEDLSPFMPSGIQGAIMKYDWGALSFDVKVCKTNTVSRTSVRAPGDVQGSYIAEAIIEKVASYLSIDVDVIRKVNLHTYESLRLFHSNKAGEPTEYTLPLLWDKLAEFSGFNQRVKVVEEFNALNRWRKRGISRVPAVYGVSMRFTPGRVSVLRDGSIVVEVPGIEIGQGLWTKVKQMVAFSLGLIQCGTTSDELLDKIRVIQADTLSLVQGSITGGSTTSVASSEAARICCDGLVERLLPVHAALVEKTGGPVTWDSLISQAYQQSINMSVSNVYTPDISTGYYLNYGVAASEVEVNILTGETTILRTDIIYDCGKSLNPAVDLGQIEGAFVQGLGFFMLEEYLMNSDGLIVTDSTWTYKIPTVDTIPRQFNVEILNSGHHKNRVLSSKASGEPPLLLAASVHCAVRAAVKEAKKQIQTWSNNNGQGIDLSFDLPVPATMPVVKDFCGLDVVEKYLEWNIHQKKNF
ncbi:PREDICTED: indole-3-acetaldehyde oxidase-like isoform X1 [Brassica oleracea var. oleracea]|uniref:indole-3-acetaldehyde oxidase-like isoform X1 n=1 Tax=Brassica oleracea var. oleracea TaxID=109376 RepID=UPI0006A747E0|nr:PREDICTED: indole-3-acetaldehyde oxidase-like isoform X1 [Brassica oleracea var. oleracea]